ncbi:MAG: hypothetical protein IKL82_00400 [Clostridia bacterium]|nr:hypothetical protein [Clostridia bacterium]
MKKNEIKSYLKRKAEQVDVKDYSSKILNNVNHEPTFEEVTVPRRKWYVPIVSFALAVCLIVAFIPSLIKNNAPTTIELTSTETVLTDEIITASSLLTTTSPVASLTSLTESSPFDKIEVGNDIKHFLGLGNLLLNDDKVTSTLYENKDKGYEKYAYKLVVTNVEDNSSYVAYYNQAVESGEETEIKGVFIIENKTFNFEAEVETEEDESEVELKIFTNANNSDNYIKVSNSVEDDGDEYEIEYSYEIVVNGETETEVSMEFSKENGREKSSIELKHNIYIFGQLIRTTTSGYAFSYSSEEIACMVSVRDFEFEIKIPVINGNFNFDFGLLD